MNRQVLFRHVLIGSLALSLSCAGGTAKADSASPGAPTNTTKLDSASEQAKATGEPVAVPELTDEYSTTVAEPDGQFTRRVSAAPERVRDSAGEWEDLDATLHRAANGGLAPTATSNPLQLSAGGSGPLATLKSGTSQLALTWPTALPQPILDGAAATYEDVLPDVDLKVTANEQGGIAEVLIVKNAAAAKNPELDRLRLLVHSANTNVAVDQAGNLSATDASGTVLFHAPTPIMWDSGDSSNKVEPQDPAVAPPASADVAKIDVTVHKVSTDTAIDLFPSQRILDDPSTNFPVYIDPVWDSTTKSLTGWAWAQEATDGKWWNTNSNGYPAVGYQGWDAGYQGRNRSYYQFDLGGLHDAHINTAKLSLIEVDTGSYACDMGRPISVYSSGQVGPTTKWSNQPSVFTLQDNTSVNGSSRDGGCGPAHYYWNIKDSVVNDPDGIVTYRVQAPSGNETDRTYYRRFGSNGSFAAVLEATYNFPPRVPTSVKISPALRNGTFCDATSTAGWLRYQTGGAFTLSADVYDTNGPDVWGAFQIWDKGTDGTGNTPTVLPWSRTDSTRSTSDPTVTRPTGTRILEDGHMYGLAARADDDIDVSPATDHCYFWYDATKPTVPQLSEPTQQFRRVNGTVTVGGKGTFTVPVSDPAPSTGGKASGIGHVNYTFGSPAELDADGGTQASITVSGSGATATIPYSPTAWGTQYLSVAAVDRAGNQSDTMTYQFYVPDDGSFKVNPGDVDGDSHPDLVGVSGDDVFVYQTTPGSANDRLPAPKMAAPRSWAPNGTSWSRTLLAHRSSACHFSIANNLQNESCGSVSGGEVDDLYGLDSGVLYLYTNNLYRTNRGADALAYGGTGSSRIFVNPPHCFDPDTCPAGYSDTWSDVTKMVAVGDLNNDAYPDLLMVKSGGSGSLWFFPGTSDSGQLGLPQLLGTGWNARDLIAPGDTNGDGINDIWARDSRTEANNGTGKLWAYFLARSCDAQGKDCAISIDHYASDGTTSFLPSSRRIMVSAGGAHGLPDGDPTKGTSTANNDPKRWDIYSITTGSKPQLWLDVTTDPQTSKLGGPSVVDDGKRIDLNDWSKVTALS